MIGGIEVRIRSSAKDESLEIACIAMQSLWPDAVFTDAESGDDFSHTWQIPFPLREILVYRNDDARKAWERHGAVEATTNTMIHLISDPDWVTAVIDDRDSEMTRAIHGIESALADRNQSLIYLVEG